jgi:hypothetical protein
MADRASDTGLQDHRGLPEGQWPGDPENLPPFIALCRQLGLFAHAVAAIDGSKFKAVNAATRTSPRPPCGHGVALVQIAKRFGRPEDFLHLFSWRS